MKCYQIYIRDDVYKTNMYVLANSIEEAKNKIDKRIKILDVTEVPLSKISIQDLNMEDVLKLLKNRNEAKIDKENALRKLMHKEGIALNGFIEYTCKLCGSSKVWHNNLVPDFCEECANKIIEKIFD